MACADWVLLCIGVNVSLLLGPGLNTNKLTDRASGARGSKSGARPNQTTTGTRHRADNVLSTLINCLNSRGCGRSHIDQQIHPRERQRGKEEEADCVWEANKDSNYFGTFLKKTCWAQWHKNFTPTPWNSVVIWDLSEMVTLWSGTKTMARCSWLFRKYLRFEVVQGSVKFLELHNRCSQGYWWILSDCTGFKHDGQSWSIYGS